MSTKIPDTHHDLLDGPVVVMLATVMPDGQPQVTPVWASRSGDEVWVNSAKGRQKDKNMRERPQATVSAVDPANPYRWIEVRGNVVETVEGDAALEHINALAHTYMGKDYPLLQEGEERVIYKIAPTRANTN